MGLKLLVLVLVALLTCAVIEGGVRLAERRSNVAVGKGNVADLLAWLPHSRISGREIGDQMLAHNVALFAGYQEPAEVTSAFVGTSRTKVLRPRWFGIDGAVNGSGNTYNEISYGLLLQAEILRLRFPNLRRVYFEASLLLRRPARLIVEEDHRKYLPLLASLLPLRDQLPGGAEFRKAVESMLAGERHGDGRLHLLRHRVQMRLSALLAANEADGDGSIPVLEDKWMAVLLPDGERKAVPSAGGTLKPEITNEHVKVQRLRKEESWAPWDGLFDLIALWGRSHGIEIVFFQPPVRSDLYQFQLANGLALHVADMHRVAREYGIPFIDMNRPDLHYMDDWDLFSDEDHLETCTGVVLLQGAIADGEHRFLDQGELFPLVARNEAQHLFRRQLGRCGPRLAEGRS
jgi:hypothetical protein